MLENYEVDILLMRTWKDGFHIPGEVRAMTGPYGAMTHLLKCLEKVPEIYVPLLKA